MQQSKLQNRLSLVFHLVLAINCNDAHCRKNISNENQTPFFSVFTSRLLQFYSGVVEIREIKTKVKQLIIILIIVRTLIIVIIVIIVAVGILKNALFRTWRSLNFLSFLEFHFIDSILESSCNIDVLLGLQFSKSYNLI